MIYHTILVVAAIAAPPPGTTVVLLKNLDPFEKADSVQLVIGRSRTVDLSSTADKHIFVTDRVDTSNTKIGTSVLVVVKFKDAKTREKKSFPKKYAATMYVDVKDVVAVAPPYCPDPLTVVYRTVWYCDPYTGRYYCYCVPVTVVLRCIAAISW